MTTIRRLTVIRSLAAAALLAGLGVYSAVRLIAQGSLTITGCSSGPCVLKAGPDFATDTFADPWDFNNRADVAIDPAQIVNISNFTVGNVVSGRAVDSNGHFAMLEQPWAGIINPGKTGGKFPINPGQYSKLAVKLAAGDGTRNPRVYWFQNALGGAGGFGYQFFDTNGTPTPVGNGIYVIDLAQPAGAGSTAPWLSGLVQGFAFYPNDKGTPFDFAFDWVRLTAADTSSTAAMMTINWSGGSSSGDITVTDAGGTVYTVKKGVGSSGGSSGFTWNYGVLPPGTYTLKVGSALQKTFTINAPPVIHVTDPDETGGADFATDVLHDPWDMTNTADVEHGVNIVPHVFNESWDGRYNATSDGVTVAMAGSVPVGDPQVYLLSNQKTSNTTDIIDSTKYHRLTFDMTVDRPFNFAEGWVGRVFWGSDSSDSAPGGTPYNVTTTKDIIMWPGTNTYTIDLATLTTANNGLEAFNATLWSQKPVRHFRIDPFEIGGGNQVTFHMDNVKLAADDETTQNHFVIHWTGSDADAGDSPVVTLYYLPVGGNPTLITSGVPLAAGQYNWDTSGVAPGTYSIYAVASDALNYTAQMSTGPVKVTTFTPTTNPFIDLDTPREGYVTTSAFEVGGWALDQASPTGTGADMVVFYVFPNNGASPGVYIGQGTYGLSRPDVGALFGSRFTNSGFHYTISGLGPGAFMLGVYARSTLTGTFSIVKTVHFTVNATALMALNPPEAEAVITGNIINIDGWSIDRSIESTALAGSGVDTLHVYAYPNPGSGAPAIFLGVAAVGLGRPDVAALYGSRYGTSGYHLGVDRNALGLAPGPYNIVVHSHSSVSGTFNTSAVVRVTLQ